MNKNQSVFETSFIDNFKLLCDELDFKVSSSKQQKLLSFLQQLEKWNKAYNLTAITDRDKMLSHHIMDSIVISPFVKQHKVADVGTGAGLPGIPLAILHPEKQFLLIDCNGKKIRFIRQTAHNLGLKNVTVLQQRVEDVEKQVDVVISRAFASLQDMAQGCEKLLNTSGCLLAMKGKRPTKELEQLNNKWHVVAEHNMSVPGLSAERCLIHLELKP